MITLPLGIDLHLCDCGCSQCKQPKKFSSTQFNMPEPIAERIRAMAAKIKSTDLAKDGLEDEPHVTVKYGLHTNDPSEVLDLVSNEKPVSLTLGKTSVFNVPDKYDVIKISVVSPDLHRLNEIISDNFEVTDSFPDYIPHITLGYVKEGKGEKYTGMTDLDGVWLRLKEFIFSNHDSEKTTVRLLPKGVSIDLAFCPTGEGGGKKNDCSPANKGTGQQKVLFDPANDEALIADERKLVSDIAKLASQIKETPLDDLETKEGQDKVAKWAAEKAYLQEKLAKFTNPQYKGLEADFEKVFPHIDELVTQAAENETPIKGSGGEENIDFSDLPESVQDSARESYENDQYSQVKSEIEDDTRNIANERISNELDSDTEWAADELVNMNAESDWGLNEQSLREALHYKGEVLENKLQLETDGEETAQEVWEKVKVDWLNYYAAVRDNRVDELVDEYMSDQEDHILNEAIDQISNQWQELDNQAKLDYVDDADKYVATTVAIPEEYSVFDGEDSQEDYVNTQSVARYIQISRSKEILLERFPQLKPKDAEDLVDKTDGVVWRAWKGTSTSSYGEALQLACVDELGALGKPEYEVRRDRIINEIGGEAKYDVLKAYIRATWESSQYVLNKAEINDVTIWRGLQLEKEQLDASRQVTLDIEAGNKARTYLPDIPLYRNGASSATADPNTANSWGGVGNIHSMKAPERAVMRIRAKASDILSLPVHGVNVHNEQEVVLTGREWIGWDLWRGTAPATELKSVGQI